MTSKSIQTEISAGPDPARCVIAKWGIFWGVAPELVEPSPAPDPNFATWFCEARKSTQCYVLIILTILFLH